MKKIFMTALVTVLLGGWSAHAWAVEGTYLNVGVNQLMISGKQAEGSGAGLVFRSQSFTTEGADRSFDGAFGVELKSARFKNEKEEGYFEKGEDLDLGAFGINADILWRPWPGGHAGVEVGIHQIEITQAGDIIQNYGTTKFAVLAQQQLGDSWNLAAAADYYMPIEEKAGDETYDLNISGVMVSAGYLFAP